MRYTKTRYVTLSNCCIAPGKEDVHIIHTHYILGTTDSCRVRRIIKTYFPFFIESFQCHANKILNRAIYFYGGLLI